jgi:hypothetical protein
VSTVSDTLKEKQVTRMIFRILQVEKAKHNSVKLIAYCNGETQWEEVCFVILFLLVEERKYIVTSSEQD